MGGFHSLGRKRHITLPFSFGQTLVLSHIPVVEEAEKTSYVLLEREWIVKAEYLPHPQLFVTTSMLPLGVSILSAHHVSL